VNVYKSFAITVTGINHKKEGKECQDASANEASPDMSAVVVADGLSDGNCFRSARGARIAVDCATMGLKECVEYLNKPEKGREFFQKIKVKKTTARKDKYSQEQFDKCLKESLVRDGIIRLWRKLVADDFTNFPFTEEELNGTEKEYKDRSRNPKQFIMFMQQHLLPLPSPKISGLASISEMVA